MCGHVTYQGSYSRRTGSVLVQDPVTGQRRRERPTSVCRISARQVHGSTVARQTSL